MTGGRPQHADVAARYDHSVDAYVDLWSPVILPPARSVIGALDLRSARVVLDVGAGAGALVAMLRAAAPAATVVGLDASREMLRVARGAASLASIEGDAVTLPLRSASVDVALLAYVLFHLSDPAVAMAEVARALTAGGSAGTITWVREEASAAAREWDAALTASGAPPLPAMSVNAGLDSPDALGMLLKGAGLRTERTWTEDLHHRWEPAALYELLAGVNRLRLQQLDHSEVTDALDHARRRLDSLPADAFEWRGRVVCAVATKGGTAAEG